MSKFPLEQLLTINKRRLDAAEKALLKAKDALVKEEQKLALAKEQREKAKGFYDEKIDKMFKESEEGTSSKWMKSRSDHLKNVAKPKLLEEDTKVKKQEEAVVKAKKEVEKARALMIQSQKDVEKIEIIKDEWKKEVRAEESRLEGILTEEIGTVTFSRIQRAKKKENESS